MTWLIAIPSTCFGATIGLLVGALCGAAGRGDEIARRAAIHYFPEDR